MTSPRINPIFSAGLPVTISETNTPAPNRRLIKRPSFATADSNVCTCAPNHAFSSAKALPDIEVDINKKQIISEQTYKNEIKDKKGIPNPILQTVFLLSKLIMPKPPA